MKERALPMLVLILLGCALPVSARDVQGELILVQGEPVLRVWGSHHDRGYAAGYLMGADAVKLFRTYVSQFIGWSQYNLLAFVYQSSFVTPPEFELEAQGLLEGARDAGVELYMDEISRELLAVDLAVMSSIPDLSALGFALEPWCSSVSAWGEGLADEPGFDGELVHARNLEWSDTSQHALAAASLVIVSIPAETDEQAWFSVGFPGMWGTLSGMNATGLGVTLNMGNHKLDPTWPCHPIMMTLRTALEKRDANGDGVCDIQDVHQTVQASSRASSYILHCFVPPSQAAGQEPDVVIETNAAGQAIRLDQDDPLVAPDILLATNHHRTLYDPVPCTRYEHLQSRVPQLRPLDTQGTYDLAREVSQGTWTLQSMILRPDPRDLFLTHIDSQGGQSPLVHITWEDMVPAGSPTPTPPVTPTVLPTPEPTTVPELGVRLELPEWVWPGEPFGVRGWLDNPGAPLQQVAVFFVLDVFGEYWFWDDWVHYDPPAGEEIDFRWMTVPTGSTELEVLPSFVWPDTGAQRVEGLYFHGAMLDPGLTALLGRMASREWGYGPPEGSKRFQTGSERSGQSSSSRW